MKKIIIGILFLVSLSAAQDSGSNFTLKSNDLRGQLSINQVFNGFGCKGKNISPELAWSGEPKETKSFAITMYDPDAPTGSGWWHWIVYDIPKNIHSLKSNASALHLLPSGTHEGITDYKTRGFGGACPPKGNNPHQYIITVYALDVAKLPGSKDANPALLGYLINAHTIAKSSLISYYGR